jgi:hypothetical protein
MTPLSIHDEIHKFRCIDKSRQNQTTSIHGDVRRRQRRTTKDSNTSMDLLSFPKINACMTMCSPRCFILPMLMEK